MPQSALVECVFYIPKQRDRDLSDGRSHLVDTWDWLNDRLYSEFGGFTCSSNWHRGFWHDPDTHCRVSDLSRQHIVAVSPRKILKLKRILAEACKEFRQKAIYLSIAGRVEFIRGDT